MPDNIILNEELGTIEIYAFGEMTVADFVASRGHIERHVQESGVTRILVNASEVEKMPSTTDLFELFSKIPDSLRLAVVVPIGSSVEEDQKFASTVARNRGANYMVF